MFTGLVEEIGTIKKSVPVGEGRSFEIASAIVLHDLQPGDSVSVDGACLTVTRLMNDSFTVDAVSETIKRTTLGEKQNGSLVNLERSLLANSRLDGHFVQGHVDGLATVKSLEKRQLGYWLSVQIPKHLVKYTVEKGSIALNGLSLTIAERESDFISVAIIPHTAANTTIQFLQPGDTLNIEVDILAKYIENMIKPYADKDGLTIERLSQLGFDTL